MSLDGLRTVAVQEFRLRIRAGRWRWLLGIWFGVVLGFAVLLRLGLAATVGAEPGPPQPLGPPLFGGVMLFVLGLGLLVVPALTAQSVNGDRERGTLATLQVTRLSAAEIALGKLAAAWGTALVFLALTVPVVAWAVAEGGLTVGKVVVTLAVVGLLLGVVCAVSQALSALLARSITSALLSYLAVFALTVGTLIAFGLVTAVTTERVMVTYEEPAYDSATGEPIPGELQRNTYQETRTRTDRTWPLLSPNPFVILADAAPRLPDLRDPVTGEVVQRRLDPLGALGNEVRNARRPPQAPVIRTPLGDERPDGGPVWPYGLAFDLALAVAAAAVTVRRLRTPIRKLPRGVRIA